MSKKLWIFGDSFASYTVAEDPRKLTAKEVEEMERHEPNKEDMWYFQLSRKLGCDKCTMIGIPGSSLDVMQHHFKNLMDQDHISKDDYIVCIHTEASRRWFVPELPEMTNFINFIDFKTGDVNWQWLENTLGSKIADHSDTQKRVRAQLAIAKDYAIGIARKDLEGLYGSAIAAWFKDFQHNGWNLISIPAYNNPEVEQYNVNFETKGSLNDVSMEEFKLKKWLPDWAHMPDWAPPGVEKAKAKRWQSFMDVCGGWDGRVGHLTPENHAVLTDKLYNSFTKNSPLDLTTEFHSNFITNKNYPEYNLYDAGPHGRTSRVSLYFAPYILEQDNIYVDPHAVSPVDMNATAISEP
jgi:hypothetical protein